VAGLEVRQTTETSRVSVRRDETFVRVIVPLATIGAGQKHAHTVPGVSTDSSTLSL
jgi:hypothetical protein